MFRIVKKIGNTTFLSQSHWLVEPRMKSLGCIFIPLIGCLVVAAEASAQATFTPIGDLPGGNFNSIAHGVADNGELVVGRGRASSSDEAFYWTLGDGMVSLGFPPSGRVDGDAQDVSADGTIITGYYSSTALGGSPEAFRWTSGTGMVGLGDLPSGDTRSFGLAVSADGSVIVGKSASTPTGDEAYRWTSGSGMVGLGDLTGGTFGSEATGVSADGSVVVGSGNSVSGTEPFRWTQPTGMVGIGELPGGSFYGVANNVSDDGFIIVGQSSSANGFEAFIWTSGAGLIALGDLPGGGFASNAFGVSAGGGVIVGQGTTVQGQEAFIWDPTNGMRNLREVLVNDYGLDLTGWILLNADDVSADGRTIVGYGTNPGGFNEAWRVTLGPVTTVRAVNELGLICLVLALMIGGTILFRKG